MPDTAPPDVGYFSAWRIRIHICRLCGWSGTGESSIQFMTRTAVRVNCPHCTHALFTVPFPSEEEIKEAAVRGIEAAVTYRKALYSLSDGILLHDPLLTSETLPEPQDGEMNFSISVDITETWLQLGYQGEILHREVLPVGTVEPVARWISILEQAYRENLGWVCMWKSALYLLESASPSTEYTDFVSKYIPLREHADEHRRNGEWDCLGRTMQREHVILRQRRNVP